MSSGYASGAYWGRRVDSGSRGLRVLGTNSLFMS